jgi:hypothetical protein
MVSGSPLELLHDHILCTDSLKNHNLKTYQNHKAYGINIIFRIGTVFSQFVATTQQANLPSQFLECAL